MLGRIHPMLGALVTGARDATRVLGDMGAKQAGVTEAVAGSTKAVGQFSGGFKALAAGGLAIAAITALTAAWRSLGEEMEKAREAQQRFRDEATAAIDMAQQFDKLRLEGIEQGTVPTGQPQADVDRQRKEFQRLQSRFGLSAEGAFARATGQAAPLTPDQERELESGRGVTARREKAAEFEKGTLGTESLEFVASQTGSAVEEIKKLVSELIELRHEGITPGESGKTFLSHPLSTLLNLVSFGTNWGHKGDPGGTLLHDQEQQSRANEVLSVLGVAAREMQKSSESLQRSAAAQEKAAASQSKSAERAERKVPIAIPDPIVVGIT